MERKKQFVSFHKNDLFYAKIVIWFVILDGWIIKSHQQILIEKSVNILPKIFWNLFLFIVNCKNIHSSNTWLSAMGHKANIFSIENQFLLNMVLGYCFVRFELSKKFFYILEIKYVNCIK